MSFLVETDAFALFGMIVVLLFIILVVLRVTANAQLPPASKATNIEKVTVRYIHDGDTLIVSAAAGEMRIRLDAIDCPEDGQPWGEISKAGLMQLIGGRSVFMERHGTDWHGRVLATIYLQNADGSEWININERMVMLGHAWVMRMAYDHLPESRRHMLHSLENQARSKRLGLWRTDNPIPPWQWRNPKWGLATPVGTSLTKPELIEK